jgi:hypothetical protein
VLLDTRGQKPRPRSEEARDRRRSRVRATVDQNRLRNVRLGRLERHVLLHASHSDSLFGYVLDASDFGRSVQEGLLRAARKLSRVGLIEISSVLTAGRAYDPRRERPVYHAGGFFLYRSKTRRHLAHRKAVWRTPLGDQIVLRFHTQLSDGRPIRWRNRRTVYAEHAAYGRSPDYQARDAANAERREGLLDMDSKDGDDVLVPLVPSFVRSVEDHWRWSACIRAARRGNPKAGSMRLWEICHELFHGGLELEALVEIAGMDPRSPSAQPPRSASERFLQRPAPTLR